MKTSFRTTAILGLLALATACTNGDGGGVEGAGGGGGVTYYVTPQTVQGLDNTQWVEDGGSVFTNNLTVTITGICSRGVSTITASVNSVDVPETAPCNGSGQFSWMKVFTGPTAATGDAKSIVFKGVGSDGTTVHYTAPAFSVTVDDQRPANPTMTPTLGAGESLVGSNYVLLTDNALATGTSSEYRITCSSSIGGAAGCGTFTYNQGSGNIALSDTLTVAVPETYTIFATDFAGNISLGGTDYTFLYSPTADPALLAEVNLSSTFNIATATTGRVGTNGSMIGGGTYFSHGTMTNGSVQFGATGILSNR